MLKKVKDEVEDIKKTLNTCHKGEHTRIIQKVIMEINRQASIGERFIKEQVKDAQENVQADRFNMDSFNGYYQEKEVPFQHFF